MAWCLIQVINTSSFQTPQMDLFIMFSSMLLQLKAIVFASLYLYEKNYLKISLHQQGKDFDGLLYHNAKLAALGEMTSAMAHEVNNPLTVIQLIAVRLKLNYERGIDYFRHNSLDGLKKIQLQVTRSIDLIDGLLRSINDDQKNHCNQSIPLQRNNNARKIL